MPLPAHSHRDSDLEEPLQQALRHRLSSVEADVWFVDGELLIGHERGSVLPNRTLERVYLRPLFEAAESGLLSEPLTLLVDIKNAPVCVYRTIQRQLAGGIRHLTRLENGEVAPGPIRVLLSGERPISAASRDSSRLVFIDGRRLDLGKDPRLFPMVSMDWGNLFDWNGLGDMPPGVRERVSQFVAEAHGAGQELRFWSTREHPEMWSELLALGVNLINGDDVEAMASFLEHRR